MEIQFTQRGQNFIISLDGVKYIKRVVEKEKQTALKEANALLKEKHTKAAETKAIKTILFIMQEEVIKAKEEKIIKKAKEKVNLKKEVIKEQENVNKKHTNATEEKTLLKEIGIALGDIANKIGNFFKISETVEGKQASKIMEEPLIVTKKKVWNARTNEWE